MKDYDEVRLEALRCVDPGQAAEVWLQFMEGCGDGKLREIARVHYERNRMDAEVSKSQINIFP